MLAKLPIGASDAMLLIETEVLKILDPYRQTDPHSTESAGVLLGYRRGDHIHIVQATLPAADDVRGRFSFTRPGKSHQQIATREWRRSGKITDYVGEWHTHPEATPAPSSTDVSEWHSLCKKSKQPLIFVILGLAHDWYGVGFGAELHPLRAVDEIRPSLGHAGAEPRSR
jgi:integrative and conjugative element protein (TIGR02256 family)